MLHITMDDSEKGLLKRSNLFNNDDFIAFCLILSYGDIKDIVKKKSKSLGWWNIDIQEKLTELDTKIKKSKEIRIWYSKLNSEEMCTMCFLIHYLSKYNNLTIYLSEVSHDVGFGLGAYAEEEIINLVDKKVILSKEEKELYKELWIKLEQENSDLRICMDNTIKSYSFDYLDEKIINFLKEKQELAYLSLIGLCLANTICNFFDDVFFRARIDYFIEKGIIKISKVQMKKGFLGELKEEKYLVVNENK